MSRRIWLLSEHYCPEETATGYFLTGIAEGLAHGLAPDYEVHVVTRWLPAHVIGQHLPFREVRNAVHIQRCWATAFPKDQLWLRVINLLTVSISILMTGLRHIRAHDLVLTVTNPPALPFFALLVCKLRKARCLLLIHDVYPDVLVAAGMLRPDSLVARGIDWLTRGLYEHAECVIVLGRDMADLVTRRSGHAPGRVKVIPNWADLAHIQPKPSIQSSLRAELGLRDKFVVQYSGNMGRTHGLETVLEAVRQLRHHEHIHFLLIGSGAKKRWVEEHVCQHHLTNLTVLPSRPATDLQDLLAAGDIGLIAFVPGMRGISVPSRMYNSLSAGRAIIAVADADSELGWVVREENVGWVVPPGDPDQLVVAILEAQSDAEQLFQMGARARLVAESKYSPEHAIRAYCELFRNLANFSQTR